MIAKWRPSWIRQLGFLDFLKTSGKRPPCEQSLLLSFSLLRREKEALPESRQLFEAAAARTSRLVNLVFSRQTGFSSASIRLVIKPMVIIEPAVPWQTKMAKRSARRAWSRTPVFVDKILLTVNSRHAWPVFLKFERRFEIYMSVLNIANEVSKFPWKFPLFIDGIKLWIFLCITTLSISRITIVSQVFWIFSFSVNASFSERFPEKCSTFHSHVGHYIEKFECSFHSRKYWSRVRWIDCNIIGMFHGLHDLICFRLRYVRLSSYWTRQILNLSTGDSVNKRVIQVVRWTLVSCSFAPDVNGSFSSHCPEKL